LQRTKAKSSKPQKTVPQWCRVAHSSHIAAATLNSSSNQPTFSHSLQVAQDNHSPVLHLSQGYILYQPAHINTAQHTAADISPNPPINLHPSVLQELQTVN
jgi:hypothetical protein